MKPYFDSSIDVKCIGITKYQNGMLLYDIRENSHPALINFVTLFALPYSVYLLDSAGATLKINDVGAEICGFNSPEQAIGRSIFDVSMENSAKNLMDNCESVLQQETVKLFDEFNLRHDGRTLHFLSIKFPCYDAGHQLRGTLGVSIVIGEHPLANAIVHLTALGLLPENTSPNQSIKLNLGSVYLTPREQKCLEYTIKGHTAKQIAKKLNLSPRTVEEYLNQLKVKFNVGSKQDMIQKVLSSSP